MLKFLKKLDYGAYEVKGDLLMKNQEKIDEFKEIEEQRLINEQER